MTITWLPWALVRWFRCKQWPEWRALHTFYRKRFAVILLKRMLKHEDPSIVHVKGRVITEAFSVFPSDRTIYQHTLMGTVDPSWEPCEVEEFRKFLHRIARVFVQGQVIAETMKREFRLDREIDVIPTMVPDESPGTEDRGQRTEDGGQRSEVRGRRTEVRGRKTEAGGLPSECRTGAQLRFGILCRFTEQKGISYILDALKTFCEDHGEIHFTFAGTGPLEDMIRSRRSEIGGQRTEDGSRRSDVGVQRSEIGLSCKDLADQEDQTSEDSSACTGLADLGPQTSDLRSGTVDIRIERVRSAVETLRDIDVFVHPGIDDAMPVSIVEALMCGIPCVTTRVGAAQEIIRDEIEGYLINPSSSEDISEAMDRCASWTKEELLDFQSRARSRYEEVCRPEVVGATVATHYRNIIGCAESGK